MADLVQIVNLMELNEIRVTCYFCRGGANLTLLNLKKTPLDCPNCGKKLIIQNSENHLANLGATILALADEGKLPGAPSIEFVLAPTKSLR